MMFASAVGAPVVGSMEEMTMAVPQGFMIGVSMRRRVGNCVVVVPTVSDEYRCYLEEGGNFAGISLHAYSARLVS